MSEAGDGFLTAERVMDWAESARPGETLTYASGDHAPAEALAAARRLADAELYAQKAKKHCCECVPDGPAAAQKKTD